MSETISDKEIVRSIRKLKENGNRLSNIMKQLEETYGISFDYEKSFLLSFMVVENYQVLPLEEIKNIKNFLYEWDMNQNKIEQDCIFCEEEFEYTYPVREDFEKWKKQPTN